MSEDAEQKSSTEGIGVVATLYVGAMVTLCAIGGWLSLRERLRGNGGRGRE